MLLRFGASNFRSLREKQDLSLIASSLKDNDTSLIHTSASVGRNVLPAAIIYGANASGKSNLIGALLMMRSLILFSHNRGEPGGGIQRHPFILSHDYENIPTAMDADFVLGEVRYHYGFEFLSDAFLSEWLYSFPSGRRTMLFMRTKGRFRFGRQLKGRNRIISELTRPNSLFVSAAAQNDHEELTKVSEFFRSIRNDRRISVDGTMAAMRYAESDVDKRVIDFLGSIGTGVVDAKITEQIVPEEMKLIQREVMDIMKKYIDPQMEIPDRKNMVVELAHEGHAGDHIYMNLDDESAGTRRLLMILGPIFEALDKGRPIIIDELDASLHTQACEAVLRLFSSSSSNPKGAQLIATTHDTNLLKSPFLRRDQIWFTEKDHTGATHLYPLTDFRTRKNDNIERGYLQGRYGAIPFSGSLDGIFLEN